MIRTTLGGGLVLLLIAAAIMHDPNEPTRINATAQTGAQYAGALP